MKISGQEIENLLPVSFKGWQPQGKAQLYTPENLYEYINGGAELFISYSFEQCLALIYVNEGLPDLIVDVFDMGNSYNAYGIFCHSKDMIDDKYGQGSESTSTSIIFWKDRYFISMMVSYEEKKGEKALHELAKIIDKNIYKKGALPSILYYLPKKSMIKESIRFFHHHVWQNAYYFIADSNLLEVNNRTPAVLVKYEESDNNNILLMIKYPENEQAQIVFNKFTHIHFPSSNIEQIVPSGTNYFKGCLLSGNIVSFVFNSTEEKHIEKLFQQIKKNIKNSR